MVAPAPVAIRVGELTGRLAGHLAPGRRAAVRGNLSRVLGVAETSPEMSGRVDSAFESYGRYWAQSFRLPAMSQAELEAAMDAEGFENLQGALALGRGAILALPHMGDWDIGAAWLTTRGLRPTVVAEALEPERLFRWFCRVRQQRGLSVLAPGPTTAVELMAALRRSDVVGLVSDRNMGTGGLPVTMFGAAATLPGGPALLSLRCGAPIVPAAVYQCPGHRYRAVMLSPLELPPAGALASRMGALAQQLAVAFERLIAAAPEQWHVLAPYWPPTAPSTTSGRSGSSRPWGSADGVG